ncbi:MAG TPA: sugar phosphate isomerase/epimerase [Vicinamibacterales bacterium]|nr:sugar phosphate isomerase/epimerase [Vicinamibacterales bacterium]
MTSDARSRAGLTRREWSGLVAGGLVVAPLARLGATQKPDSRVAGVRIGAQTYSFRGMSLADTATAMASIGLSYCELWQGQVETQDVTGGPRPPETASRAERQAAQREGLRAWRLSVPLDHFRQIRRLFDEAGVTLTAYNLSFQNDFTDAEIDRGFAMARALGVDVITASSRVSTAARLDPFAITHGITVAFHNHSRIADDEFARPEDFARALEGRSNRMAVNLDIGHFNGAGFDALAYLDAHHDRIVSLPLKDKVREGDRNVPWGEGDTPIGPVLQRLRDRGWDIPAQIEYEYRGQDPVTEVRRCYEYCRTALGRES